MQQAWRDLAALNELVTLAMDVDHHNRAKNNSGQIVSALVQIVDDPFTHGGTSVDLRLSSVGMRTLPDDSRHRLRELGTRGAQLTFRPYPDAVNWLDRNYWDLPTDQRRAIIRQLDDRWRTAA